MPGGAARLTVKHDDGSVLFSGPATPAGVEQAMIVAALAAHDHTISGGGRSGRLAGRRVAILWRQIRSMLPRRHLNGGRRSRRVRRRNVRSGPRRARAPDDSDVDPALIGGGP